MSLSARDQRILAAIEDHLTEEDPNITRLFATLPVPGQPDWRRWPARLGLLTVALLAVVVAHPVAARAGAVGVGVLTAALIVPWLITTARATAGEPPRPPDLAADRSAGMSDGPRITRNGPDHPYRSPLLAGVVGGGVLVIAVNAFTGAAQDVVLLVAVTVLLVAGVRARYHVRRALLDEDRRDRGRGDGHGPGPIGRTPEEDR